MFEPGVLPPDLVFVPETFAKLMTVMSVHLSWLSTVAQPVPLLELFEVKVELARPAVIVPAGGDMVPWVALHATGVGGNVPEPDVFTASELILMSAVTVELPPCGIGLGDALTPSCSHGLKSAVPVTVSQPALPGPALQPHQLFSAVTMPSTLLSPVNVFPTMRLKLRFALP